jgi:hypothetical protein
MIDLTVKHFPENLFVELKVLAAEENATVRTVIIDLLVLAAGTRPIGSKRKSPGSSRTAYPFSPGRPHP